MDYEKLMLFVPGFVIGLTIHEASHAISAKWLGDDTAQKRGRISLNPLRHFSLVGTIALFMLGFGWGKPVPVNIHNFTKPRFHFLLTSLAGPVSNLILSAIALGLLYLRPPYILFMILVSIYFVNAMLAIFNLLPVPPLDGSKIWPVVIPGAEKLMTGQYSGIWFIVLLIGFYTGLISKIMAPVFAFFLSLLPGAG